MKSGKKRFYIYFPDLCHCGCGTIVYGNNRFVDGHSGRGKNNYFYGKHTSPHNKGISPSLETRKKMSDSRKGKPTWNKGRKYPQLAGDLNPSKRPEVRKKISESNRGKSHGGKGKKKSKEHNEKNSIAQKGTKKPWSVENARKMNEKIRLNPDFHPNRIMAKQGFISKPQFKLYNIIKQYFPDAELEFPIRTQHGLRFADIGVPSLKMDFEYNGAYWHKNHEDSDTRRKFEIEESGWNVVTVTEKELL